MRRSSFLFRLTCLLLGAVNLSSCASGSTAISQTVKMLASRGHEADSVTLSPGMRYLRVNTEGRVVIMALGYVESHPRGDIEVWYSAKGEVIRLQGGRIVGTTGLATDWREVRNVALPSWGEAQEKPVEFRRERDEMPGYRFHIQETLSLHAAAPPSTTNLSGVDANKLRWFEERVVSGDGSVLPPARYAVGMTNGTTDVVYAEQCLAANLCLAWQRWSAEMGTRN